MRSRDKTRRKQYAEYFTPPALVNQMLDKLPEVVWEDGKTFCDPACGTGNMLTQVLWRKMSKNHNPLKALQSIYGVDIMPDSIEECRHRLLRIISIYEDVTEDHRKAVAKNIVCLDLEKYPRVSLDYVFSFEEPQP